MGVGLARAQSTLQEGCWGQSKSGRQFLRSRASVGIISSSRLLLTVVICFTYFARESMGVDIVC